MRTSIQISELLKKINESSILLDCFDLPRIAFEKDVYSYSNIVERILKYCGSVKERFVIYRSEFTGRYYLSSGYEHDIISFPLSQSDPSHDGFWSGKKRKEYFALILKAVSEMDLKSELKFADIAQRVKEELNENGIEIYNVYVEGAYPTRFETHCGRWPKN